MRKLHARRGTQGPVGQHPAAAGDRLVRHTQEFKDRLVYLHLNPVRKELVSKPEEWRWSSYNNFALDKAAVAGCPIQVDEVRLPEGYRT